MGEKHYLDKEKQNKFRHYVAKRSSVHAEMVKQPVGEYYKKFIKPKKGKDNEGTLPV